MLCGGQSKLHLPLHLDPMLTPAGRIVGSIVMFVGIGITSIFISTLAPGLTISRTKGTFAENNPKLILKIRLAKGEITKETYSELFKVGI